VNPVHGVLNLLGLRTGASQRDQGSAFSFRQSPRNSSVPKPK
jgi:hypothetical protein